MEEDKKVSETIRATVMIDGMPQEMEVMREQKGFDPMTGQPVMEVSCRRGFDPMTGQPVYVKLAQTGFDAMTGKPVFKPVDGTGASMPAPSTPTPGFPRPADAGMQPPVKDNFGMPAAYDGWGQPPVPPARRRGGNKNFLPFIIGGASLLLIAIIVIVGITSGVFLSKRNKVAMAAYKTINDSTIGEQVLNASEVLRSDKVTVQLGTDVGAYGLSADVDGTFSCDAQKGAIGFDADVDVAGVIDQEIEFYYDDSMVALGLPKATNEVYSYDYTSDSDGYLADFIEYGTEGSIEDLNAVLAGYSEIIKKSPAGKKAFTKAIKNAYKGVEVNSIEKKTWTVDGKDRKCAGYEMIVTPDNIEEFIYAIMNTNSEIYEDDYNEIFNAIGNLAGEDMSYASPYNRGYAEEIAEELAEEFEEEYEEHGGNMIINVYVYGGKLAAICTIVDGDDLCIEFKGGDTRCSDVTVTFASDSVELESSINGGVEEGTVYYYDNHDEEEVFSYEYDKNDGYFVINAYPLGLGTYEGQFKAGKHDFEMSTDIPLGSFKVSLDLLVSDKASVKKPGGDYIDMGDVGLSELEDIFKELEDLLSLDDVF